MAATRRSRDGRKFRILVVDDHPLFREGLGTLIELEPDLEVCGEAEEADQALAAVLELKPDVAIVDISLSTSSGLSLIKDIRARRLDLPILVLTMHKDPVIAERALKAGATGYVTKQEDPSVVLIAIRKVLDGDIYVSDKLASLMLRCFTSAGRERPKSVLELLTDREFEVFQLIGQGLPTRAIAERMHLSIKTVNTHRENIKKKLGLESATELAQRALRWTQGDSGT